MKTQMLAALGLLITYSPAALAQSPAERQLQAQILDLETRVQQLEAALRRAGAVDPPRETPVRAISNGGETAVQGLVNGGSGIGVAGYSASKTQPAMLGASTGYYGGLFFNVADLGSNSANASAIGVVAQSVYSNALYAQQGGAPGSPGDTLTRDNVYPAAYITRVTGGLNGHDFTGPLLQVEDTTTASGGLLELVRQGVALVRVPAGGAIQQFDAHGAYWERGVASELVTLSTAAAATETRANLLPANSIIEAVVARVTSPIAGASGWKIGDQTTSNRFSDTNTNTALGATEVGLLHVDRHGLAGATQVQTGKVRVTTDRVPRAGAIRITVFYRTFVPPTS